MRSSVRSIAVRGEPRGGGRIVSQVGSVHEALNALRTTRPDVVVTDLRLADGTGWDVLDAVRELAPHASAILITSFHSADVVARAALRKARYLDKMMDGGMPLFVEALGTEIDGSTRADDVEVAKREVAAALASEWGLTAKEHEVLELIACGCVEREEIARACGIELSTAKNRVAAVCDKLRRIVPDGNARAIEAYALDRALYQALLRR